MVTYISVKWINISPFFFQYSTMCVENDPHSSEKRRLCLMKCSNETLQNLPYFLNMKIRIEFSFSDTLFFFPNECPGLCRHRPGHSLGKNIRLYKMKNEKNYKCFPFTKIWQILKRFSRALS